MMPETLDISVLLPVVDEWDQLETALKSIVSQDFESYEVIIRIDGAAQRPNRVLFEDKHIHWLSGDRIGLAASLNQMASQAKGGLLLRCDADDEMLSDRMRVQYECWKKNPDSLIAGKAQMLAEDGTSFVYGETNVDYVLFLLLLRNPIIHSSVAMPKKIFEELGGYNESWELAQDYELWLRWVNKYPLELMDDVLCRYHHRLVEGKMEKQWQLMKELVTNNVSTLLPEWASQEVYELIAFAGGGGVTRNFFKYAKAYRLLFEKYSTKENCGEETRERFEDFWPYLLGRNVCAMKMSFLSRLCVVLKYPEIMKAYRFKRILFD